MEFELKGPLAISIQAAKRSIELLDFFRYPSSLVASLFLDCLPRQSLYIESFLSQGLSTTCEPQCKASVEDFAQRTKVAIISFKFAGEHWRQETNHDSLALLTEIMSNLRPLDDLCNTLEQQVVLFDHILMHQNLEMQVASDIFKFWRRFNFRGQINYYIQPDRIPWIPGHSETYRRQNVRRQLVQVNRQIDTFKNLQYQLSRYKIIGRPAVSRWCEWLKSRRDECVLLWQQEISQTISWNELTRLIGLARPICVIVLNSHGLVSWPISEKPGDAGRKPVMDFVPGAKEHLDVCKYCQLVQKMTMMRVGQNS